jgi:outer membrane receptor protein involved in Fe transport
MFRGLLIKAMVTVAACCLTLAANAMAATPRAVHIAPGPLVPALESLSKQMTLELIYQPEQLESIRTRGVSGTYTPQDAVRILLEGTPLDLRVDASGAMAVVPRESPRGGPAMHDSRQPDNTKGGAGDDSHRPFRMAQVAQEQSSGAAPLAQLPPSGAGQLQEVIVTANKRAETLFQVAGSVTAFTGAELSAIGAQSFQDYLSQAPGVIFQSSTPGVGNVTIRGIGTATVYPDQGQSTTGIYLDGVPLTDPGFAMSVPDLDVFDVQRVEVLKGPQGTLFGSATLGGAVNYVLNPVSLTSYQALAEAGLSGTEGSGQVGQRLDGAVNIPLVPGVLGVRLTAAEHFDPGWLDNVGIGRDDTNTHRVFDYRISALWQLNDRFSLSFLSFRDDAHSGDGFYAFPALGDLKRDTIIAEVATFVNQVNSLKFDGDLGFANLSITTSYSNKTQVADGDLTPFYGNVPTTSPAYARDLSRMAEVRLSSPGEQRLEWLVGLYYGSFFEPYPTPTYQGGVDVYDFTVWYKSTEAAGFGDLTYHLTDHWRLTFGGRYYHDRLFTETASGAPGTPYDIVAGTQKGDGFIPKGSITFEPSSNFLVYGLVSTGFRMGGVNLVPPIPSFQTPATYKSDSLTNYEIGLRDSMLHRTLFFNSTLFYVDWQDVQIRLNRPDGYTYVANAGAAKSEGLENAIEWAPTAAFDFRANITYLDAQLTRSLALGGGTTLQSGAQLPGASKWSTSETATYHFDLRHDPYVSFTHRYLSGAPSAFVDPLPVGDYSTYDFRAGAEFGNFSVAAYVDNLTNKRGITAAEFFGTAVTDFYVLPLTAGLQVDWHL